MGTDENLVIPHILVIKGKPDLLGLSHTSSNFFCLSPATFLKMWKNSQIVIGFLSKPRKEDEILTIVTCQMENGSLEGFSSLLEAL